MATRELTSESSPSWLDDWWRPFLWITLTPIVTVPLSKILFPLLAGVHEPQEIGLPPNRPIDLFWDGGPGECNSMFSTPCYEYFQVVPTVAAFTVPGLINLVPIVWIASTSVKARIAGIVAGLLGLLRLCVPVMVLMLSFDTITSPGGTSYFKSEIPWLSSGLTPHIAVWSTGVLAWFGSLLVWAVFRVLTRGPEGARLVSFLLGIAGVLCLGLGLTRAEGLPYVSLPLVIVGAGALGFAVLGLMPGRPEETGHVR
jgi:hypothetical protein